MNLSGERLAEDGPHRHHPILPVALVVLWLLSQRRVGNQPNKMLCAYFSLNPSFGTATKNVDVLVLLVFLCYCWKGKSEKPTFSSMS